MLKNFPIATALLVLFVLFFWPWVWFKADQGYYHVALELWNAFCFSFKIGVIVLLVQAVSSRLRGVTLPFESYANGFLIGMFASLILFSVALLIGAYTGHLVFHKEYGHYIYSRGNYTVFNIMGTVCTALINKAIVVLCVLWIAHVLVFGALHLIGVYSDIASHQYGYPAIGIFLLLVALGWYFLRDNSWNFKAQPSMYAVGNNSAFSNNTEFDSDKLDEITVEVKNGDTVTAQKFAAWKNTLAILKRNNVDHEHDQDLIDLENLINSLHVITTPDSTTTKTAIADDGASHDQGDPIPGNAKHARPARGSRIAHDRNQSITTPDGTVLTNDRKNGKTTQSITALQQPDQD